MGKRVELAAKTNIIDAILTYKEALRAMSVNIDKVQDLMMRLRKIELFTDIDLKDIRNMASNKLISLYKEFEAKDVDMLYFYDDESKEYYSSKFFTDGIMGLCLDDLLMIDTKLLEFVSIFLQVCSRVSGIQSKVLRVWLGELFEYNIFTNDLEVKKLVAEAQGKYQEYIDAVNNFYNTSLNDYFWRLSKQNLVKAISKEDEQERNTALEFFYGIDMDFSKHFGTQETTKQVTTLYKEILEDAGFDSSFLDQIQLDVYFTKMVSENAEMITSYMKMDLMCLSIALYNAKMESFSAFLEENPNTQPISKIVNLFCNFKKL